jgi:hypothetical protein
MLKMLCMRVRTPRYNRSSAADFQRHAPAGFTSEQIVAAISNARGRPLTAVFQDSVNLTAAAAAAVNVVEAGSGSSPVPTTASPLTSVCVIARQQPLAAQASWLAEGLMRRLADPRDAASIDLLVRCGVAVVPNACPEGSDRCLSRTNISGADVSLSWARSDTADVPEVEACREAIHAARPDLIIEVGTGARSARVELVVVHPVTDGGDTASSGDESRAGHFCDGLERANSDCRRVAVSDTNPTVVDEGSLSAWASAHLLCPTVVVLLPSTLAPQSLIEVGRACVDALRHMVTVDATSTASNV